jgi:hypothetical protein
LQRGDGFKAGAGGESSDDDRRCFDWEKHFAGETAVLKPVSKLVISIGAVQLYRTAQRRAPAFRLCSCFGPDSQAVEAPTSKFLDSFVGDGLHDSE